jgi:sterol desaturase/sphingolipid hydroxylase (fatty acid hydroxylase superfamily)
MLHLAAEQWIVLVSTPLYAGFILFEILVSNAGGRHWYSVKNTLQNVYLMLLNAGLDLLMRGAYLVLLAYLWQYKWLVWQPNWVYWLLLVVLLDFMFYWMHRLEHEVRLFWAVHVTHHSSHLFNLTVGFRSSVFQPIYRFIFFIPLVFLGFQPLDIVLVFSATQIWGILVHTEMVNKLGWLEYFLVTPSHHRVHHASNALYLDKNMGMFLIIWDKLFGTFQQELSSADYEPIRYGLTTPKDLAVPLELVLHEWRDIAHDLQKDIPVGQKLQYIFGPPGWSHDGSRLTSEQLRAMQLVGVPTQPDNQS